MTPPKTEPAKTPGGPPRLNDVGGAPVRVQTEETPAGFTFLFQLDAAHPPFWLNFGDAGVGYAFADRASGAGRFLWQGA